jgi:hypothetical protein
MRALLASNEQLSNLRATHSANLLIPDILTANSIFKVCIKIKIGWRRYEE